MTRADDWRMGDDMQHRLNLRISDDDLERIRAYQNEQNLESQSEALRKLIRDQLDAEGIA